MAVGDIRNGLDCRSQLLLDMSIGMSVRRDCGTIRQLIAKLEERLEDRIRVLEIVVDDVDEEISIHHAADERISLRLGLI